MTNSAVKGVFVEFDNLSEREQIKLFKDLRDFANKVLPDNTDLIVKIIPNLTCGDERPQRRVFCQLPKGHKGSHQAVVFWEDEASAEVTR